MFEEFFAKLAGKFAKKKLNLQEGTMETKPWYKSKNIWTGVVVTLLAAYGTAATQFGLPTTPEWIYAFLGALGIYTRATADTKITT